MNTIKAAIDDLFNSELTAEDAVERHFDPLFRQRVNGNWLDRHTFLARIISLREIVARVTITVLDEFSDGNRYSERHVIDVIKRDGERVLQEVYLFAERSQDGRFSRIQEATITVESR
ncbi:nuclear transport factor 2 family protein [Allopusillimonas ginsengisoli]|uniref:nuclear transport factor 2 family protein n=1 Tax=Allopusillimonas ginsengisoli TaxID=453575 RepID=UPI001FD6BBD9|nr:nuclear transport factor 2 family protein [Allopusillimonas ginsengisoli]